MRKWLIAAAMLLMSALGVSQPAMAQTDTVVSGVTFSGGMTCSDTEYEFRPGSGTPTIDLAACMPSVGVGYSFQVGDQWYLAFGAEGAFGEAQACVRDGNAIVQCLNLNGIATVEVRAGYNFDNGVGLFVTVGGQETYYEYVQSCGVGAAYGGGHCASAGGPTGYVRTAEDTLRGWVPGVGVRLRLARRVAVEGHLRYQQEDARERSYDGPNGVGNPLNPIRPDETRVPTLSIRLTGTF